MTEEQQAAEITTTANEYEEITKNALREALEYFEMLHDNSDDTAYKTMVFKTHAKELGIAAVMIKAVVPAANDFIDKFGSKKLLGKARAETLASLLVARVIRNVIKELEDGS